MKDSEFIELEKLFKMVLPIHPKRLFFMLNFEKNMNDAREADQQCCRLLADFWREVAKRRPDRTAMASLADKIIGHIYRARSSYERLVKMAPDSAVATRLYSGFLFESFEFFFFFEFFV
jgi:hypothetical protein